MSQTYNIYCDESGHMENDREKVMVIGAVRCLLERTRGIAVRVRKIKVHHVTKRKSLIPFPVQQGFTDEELDFIINYDIKYRMGRDSEEEG